MTGLTSHSALYKTTQFHYVITKHHSYFTQLGIFTFKPLYSINLPPVPREYSMFCSLCSNEAPLLLTALEGTWYWAVVCRSSRCSLSAGVTWLGLGPSVFTTLSTACVWTHGYVEHTKIAANTHTNTRDDPSSHTYLQHTHIHTVTQHQILMYTSIRMYQLGTQGHTYTHMYVRTSLLPGQVHSDCINSGTGALWSGYRPRVTEWAR